MPTTIDEQIKNYLYHNDGLKLPGNANRLNLCVICGNMAPKGGVYTCKGEDVICEECLKKYEGLAYLMCRACGKFHGFYKPGIVKLDSGVKLRIDPGDTLHFTWCWNCNPNLGKYDIEEFKTAVLQANGLAPKTIPEEDKNGMERKS